jgi:CDP-glucose 4,6-dehydratase
MTLEHSFKGKTVLVTGHTGFKGSWLSVWLNLLNANVIGLSNGIPTTPSNFKASNVGSLVEDNRIDIRNAEDVRKVVQRCQPDVVFHLAAQAHVRPSYKSPLDTITTNCVGSANVLDALRTLNKPVIALMITSDKAYDNMEWVWGYRETDHLGGKDPYSASKGMAELVIRTYFESFFNMPSSNVRVGIARAGNVIGGGDWALDRIVPDCINAWSRGEIVDIRNPRATRPWQHVLEPLSGYLALSAELAQSDEKHGEAFNFGPPADQNYSVKELIEKMQVYWENAQWKDVSKERAKLHEAGLLKLNCDKALFNLNWQPTLQINETIRMTVEWYKVCYEGASMHDFTVNQITEYRKMAQDCGLSWAK